ncbi:MAG: toll/interleukin-1 receptor domain-containing protein [Opitutus sp.]|nr:toll/interleukin-1 receptor domain-containing protein [Opitutus sp.]
MEKRIGFCSAKTLDEDRPEVESWGETVHGVVWRRSGDEHGHLSRPRAFRGKLAGEGWVCGIGLVTLAATSTSSGIPAPTPMPASASSPGIRAVFISYAHEDTAVVQRLAEALRAAGVEVWFDQSELRGGDAWDADIRAQVEACALFVAVVSTHTQARREGYFRLEWHLADDRTHLMAEGTPFLLPVVIDDTKERGALVPKSFLGVQWTRLPGGEAPDAFVQRVRSLLGSDSTLEPGRPRLAQRDEACPPGRGVASPESISRRRFPIWATAAFAAIVLGAGSYLALRTSSSAPSAAAKPPADLAGQIRRQILCQIHRRASVREPERRQGKRIFHRRDARRHSHPALEDPGVASDLPHLGRTIPRHEKNVETGRRRVGRGLYSGGQRAALRQQGARDRPAHSRGHRRTPVGAKLRP